MKLSFFDSVKPSDSNNLTNFSKRSEIATILISQMVDPLDKDKFIALIKEFCTECRKLKKVIVQADPVIEYMNMHDKLKALRSQRLSTTSPAKNSNASDQKMEATDYKCCICYERQDLHISKCKHVACWSCWDVWLSKYLECPACRQRIRKNQIIRI